MMRTLLVTFTCAFALISTSAYAVDPTGESVVIRNEADKTFYEYHRGGEIVEIKVVPKYGKPYYLTPTDAKGAKNGQYIQSDAPDISVPSWVIFRW